MSCESKKCTNIHWGRSTHRRIQSERAAAKVSQGLFEKLIARGRAVWLHLPVTSGVVCTCRKETSETNDRICNECYGNGYVPGFTRFMHSTVFFGVSEADLYTLTGCYVDESIKPHRILMDDGVTSATIETHDKAFSNAGDDDWETHTDLMLRQGSNTFLVEFSTDSGTTWRNVNVINGGNKPTGSGIIRFRITMNRAAATDRSPAFEIVRARHVNSENFNRDGWKVWRPDMAAGQILVLRPWAVEQTQSDTGRGVTVDWMGDRSWTMPLNRFSTAITADTQPARIEDTAAGPHPFYRHATGIKTGQNVVMTTFKWNESLGIFTHQSFDERLAQANEDPYSEVW